MSNPSFWQLVLPADAYAALAQALAVFQWPAGSVEAWGLGAVLGLVVGSFLNVVIVRLPQMLEREWALAESPSAASGPAGEQAVFNLSKPASHCPHCGHVLPWFENIPLFSFVGLRGRCSACGSRIAWRYPLMEFATALIFSAVFGHWGSGFLALAWCGFAAALLAAAAIDWDCTLLPDDICLPLMWAGLLLASWGVLPHLSLHDALWGAALGYLSLASVAWGFERMTGQVGMGHGDFKLLAAIGAWLGWQTLLPVLMGACLVGLSVGLWMKRGGHLHQGRYVPFGPFLAGAALCLMWPQARLWASTLWGTQ
jgi:leader peptidase (prepilin peptidase)/N-methyltransferase